MARSKVFQSLIPPVRLRVPEEHRWRLTWMLKLLDDEGRHHPLLQEPLDQWRDKNKVLAARAQAGDDDAFCKLCQRDPRYLGTEFAVFKLLQWKLQIVYADVRVHHGERTTALPSARFAASQRERRERAHERVQSARRSLDGLRAAVRFVTGRGKKSYARRRGIWSDYQYALAAARDAKILLAKHRRITATVIEEVASEVDLGKRHVELFHTSKKIQPSGVALSAVAEAWGYTEDRAKKLIGEARKLKIKRSTP